MAIARIDGTMLKSNLLRQGIDFAVETDLLYFDVGNGRIGIQTNSPDQSLHVIGGATVDNLSLTTNTITSIDTDGDINLTPDGTGIVAISANLTTTNDILLTEQTDHSLTPAAGFGQVWLRDDGPNNLMFTDDAGTDFILGGVDLTVPVVADLDGDTQIQVEEGADEDIIRFDTGDAQTNFPAQPNALLLSSAEFTLLLPNSNVATTAGSPISLTAGDGNTTGAGGAITLQAGDQGATDGGGGGAINIISGDCTVGTGGGLFAQAGDVNITSGTGYYGGDINILGGTGYYGSAINITGGASNAPGGSGHCLPITITGGLADGFGGNAGSIILQGGDTNGGGGSAGGSISLIGASSTETFTGGFIALTGGTGGETYEGDGGPITLTAGNAGAGTGTGGIISITSGDGGGTTGIGGPVNITAGDGDAGGIINIIGGIGSVGPDTGGHVNITGGASSGTGYEGGDVVITGGASGVATYVGGDVTITGGAGSDANGGAVTIAGGHGSDAGTGNDGGDIDISGGTPSTNSGQGGHIFITVPASLGIDSGGVISIQSGDANTTGVGGYMSIQSGDGAGVSAGGPITITSGAGGSSGAGGPVSITSGAGGSASGTGGALTLTSGAGTNGDGPGGDIILTPGAGDGSGSAGAINITQTTAPTSTTDKLYNVSGVLTWNGVDLSEGTALADADGDTQIQVEESADEDIIRFDTGDNITGFPAQPNALLFSSGQFTLVLPTANIATTVGGAIALTAGDGNTTGDGGAVTLTGGVGADATADGGAITLQGGDTSLSGTVNTTYGGAINLIGGAGYYGGTINITGGAGYYGAEVNITAGTVNVGGGQDALGVNITGGTGGVDGGDGGDIIITGGPPSAAGGEGGLVALYGPDSTGSDRGGDIRIHPGDGGPDGTSAAGGDITLGSGDGGASGNRGGFIYLYAGQGVGSGGVGGHAYLYGGRGIADTGGQVKLVAGRAGGSYVGGPINIIAGEGGLTDGDGGPVNITGGAGGATNSDGGDIVLTPGPLAGSGNDGAINITQTTVPASTTDKLYNLAGALTWNGIDLTDTNATHTGQVTGATALALDITAVTAQPASGAISAADTIITNDGGVLSEATFTQMDTYFDSSLAFGDVFKVSTPSDNEIGVWTGDGTIEGEPLLLFNNAATTTEQMEVTANASLTSGSVIRFTSNLSGKTGDLVEILQNHASSSADCLTLTQNSTNANAVLFEGTHQGATSAPYAARIRTSGIFSGGDVLLLHHDNASSTGPVLTLTQDGTGVALDATGGSIQGDEDFIVGTEMLLTERADHVFTPVATRGIFWVRDDAPNVPIFTDDAGTDHVLAAKGFEGILSTAAATLTLDATHFTVVATLAGNQTFTLPTAVGIAGRIYNLKKTGASGTTILDGDGTETIDGSLTFETTTQYESITVQSDGSNWLII